MVKMSVDFPSEAASCQPPKAFEINGFCPEQHKLLSVTAWPTDFFRYLGDKLFPLKPVNRAGGI
jgi:hypothetical protein